MNPLKKLTAGFSRMSLNSPFHCFLTAIRRSSEASKVFRKFWKKETITMYSSSQMQGSEALALQKDWSKH